MGIYYNQEERVFRLDTPGSTYLISIVDEEGFLCHTYYGRRIPDDNMGYLLRLPAGGTDFRNNGRQADLMGRLPAEYPGHGLGDFRESCLQAETPEGLIGKVVAVIMTLVMCAQPLGNALYGFLFEAWAGFEAAVVFFAGAVSLGIGLWSRRVFSRL